MGELELDELELAVVESALAELDGEPTWERLLAGPTTPLPPHPCSPRGGDTRDDESKCRHPTQHRATVGRLKKKRVRNPMIYVRRRDRQRAERSELEAQVAAFEEQLMALRVAALRSRSSVPAKPAALFPDTNRGRALSWLKTARLEAQERKVAEELNYQLRGSLFSCRDTIEQVKMLLNEATTAQSEVRLDCFYLDIKLVRLTDNALVLAVSAKATKRLW